VLIFQRLLVSPFVSPRERQLGSFCTLHRNEVPRTDPLVQVDYVRVVDLDMGANKSDFCAIRVVTILERAGRIRAYNRGSV
jgi:hypothetical protein